MRRDVADAAAKLLQEGVKLDFTFSDETVAAQTAWPQDALLSEKELRTELEGMLEDLRKILRRGKEVFVTLPEPPPRETDGDAPRSVYYMLQEAMSFLAEDELPGGIAYVEECLAAIPLLLRFKWLVAKLPAAMKQLLPADLRDMVPVPLWPLHWFHAEGVEPIGRGRPPIPPDEPGDPGEETRLRSEAAATDAGPTATRPGVSKMEVAAAERDVVADAAELRQKGVTLDLSFSDEALAAQKVWPEGALVSEEELRAELEARLDDLRKIMKRGKDVLATLSDPPDKEADGEVPLSLYCTLHDAMSFLAEDELPGGIEYVEDCLAAVPLGLRVEWTVGKMPAVMRELLPADLRSMVPLRLWPTHWMRAEHSGRRGRRRVGKPDESA